MTQINFRVDSEIEKFIELKSRIEGKCEIFNLQRDFPKRSVRNNDAFFCHVIS